MPDPTATFADIARVLRPGGTLVIACRTSDTPPPAWMDPDVYRIPTAAQLTAMLTAAGFDRVDHHTVDTVEPRHSTCSPPTSPTTRLTREHHRPPRPTAPGRPPAHHRHRRPRLGDATRPAARRVLGRDVRPSNSPTHPHTSPDDSSPGSCPTPTPQRSRPPSNDTSTDCGLPVPAIRAANGPTSELDRAWTLMDHAPGQPLLTGLSATGALRRAPTLLRRLPDLLARRRRRPPPLPDRRTRPRLDHHTTAPTSTTSSHESPNKPTPSAATTSPPPPDQLADRAPTSTGDLPRRPPPVQPPRRRRPMDPHRLVHRRHRRPPLRPRRSPPSCSPTRPSTDQHPCARSLASSASRLARPLPAHLHTAHRHRRRPRTTRLGAVRPRPTSPRRDRHLGSRQPDRRTRRPPMARHAFDPRSPPATPVDEAPRPSGERSKTTRRGQWPGHPRTVAQMDTFLS